MAVGVAKRTLAQVVKEVMRLCGFILNEGTATAGTTTTLTDANNERTPTAQSQTVLGTYIYTTGGLAAAVGNAREVTTYSTLGVFTWIQAVGTAPDSTTTWIRTSVRPQRIIDAIDEITRAGWRTQAISYLSEALISNNLLEYFGTMEEWGAGASSAPDGWTLGGAGASVSRAGTTTASVGYYRASLTAGAGAVGTLTRNLTYEQAKLITGISLTLLGAITETNAGDAVVRVAVINKSNVTTNTDRTGTYTASNNEELSNISSASIATPVPMIGGSVQLRAAAGTTVSFDDLVLYGPRLYDYLLPPILIGLEPVIWMETEYRSRNFSHPLYYGGDWIISQRNSAITGETEQILHFLRPLPSARHLLIYGFQAPAVQATATSNVEPNPVWLAYATAVRVLEQERLDEQGERRLARLRTELNGLEHSSDGNTTLGNPVVWIEGS